MKMIRSMATAVLAAASLLGLQAHAARPPAVEPVAVARTPDGALRGISKDGVNAFLGVPYAAPPVGDLRWRPPQRNKPWKGVRDATRKGPSCAQVTTLGVFAGPPSAEEDCLYLNVYASGKKRAAGQKMPVLLWIHGGALLDGSGNDYEGWKLASGGPEGVPTVVVAINYRLGMFGMASHPALDREGHAWGNYALMDQQEALRWVKRNIAAFGGDPENVTLAGESAGAQAVLAQLVSPTAKGLFQRTILMSSPGFQSWFAPTGVVTTQGRNFAAAAGCPGEDEAAAKCLRKLSAARILQIQGTLAAGGPYNLGYPFIDGTVITMSPEQAWSSGNFNKVPVMGGGMKDEAMFFYAGSLYFNAGGSSRTSVSVPKTPEDYAAATAPGAFCIWCNAERKMPPGTPEAYPLSQFGGDVMYAVARIGTDGGRCREVHVLDRIADAGVPVYAYEFAYEDAPFYFPKFAGYKPRAAHTLDLQFVFDGYHGGNLGVNLDQTTGMPRGLNPAESRLSDLMVATWTRFAKFGNPNGSGDAGWPRYTSDPEAGKYFIQDLDPAVKTRAQFRAEHKCDFFDPQLRY
jgi:para-nitrobenzyl esterase